MSEAAKRATPQWIEDAWETLRIKYLIALRMEDAVKKFETDYDKHYKDQIYEKTKELEDTGGGVISNVEQALAALGPVADGGSNWLAAKTTWRRFGLTTGYNMQHQKGSVLDDPEAAGKWAEFWNLASAQEIHARGRLIEDPIYFTAVPGSAEPGAGTSNTVDDLTTAGASADADPLDATIRSAVGALQRTANLAENNPSARPGPGDTRDSGIGTAPDYEVAIKKGFNSATKFFKFRTATSLNYDQVSLSREETRVERFLDTAIKVENFFQDASSGQQGTDAQRTGHFLSPEMVYYAQTDRSSKDLKSAGDSLMSFREELMNKGEGLAMRNFPSRITVNSNHWGKQGAGPAYYAWKMPDRAGSPLYSNTPDPALQTTEENDLTVAVTGQFSTGKQVIHPQAVVVWPTLPLAVISGQEQTRGNISGAWNQLYTQFVNGSGALMGFDQKMRAIYKLEKDAKGKPGDKAYDAFVYAGVEEILDFFGAGLVEAPTPEQALGEGETGQQIALAALTEEARKKILKFRNLKPFDFQCFLIENIALLAGYKDKIAFGADHGYENIVRLSEGSEPGTTISTINMGNKEKEVEQLLNLQPAVYAALVPYIRIYRVWYDKDNGTVPIYQEEMPIPNYVPAEDIERLTGLGGGRYSGWGLQNFTWSLDGIQPADVDNNITANLTFYFQSLTDFFQGAVAAGGAVPKPLDLLISPPTIASVRGASGAGAALDEQPGACGDSVKDNINRTYRGQYFRIKVVAGWATPPNLAALLPKADPKELDTLRSALASTRIPLYLQQTRHQLNFNQDGSLALSIDYRASLSGMLTSNRMDILGANSVEDRAQLDDLQKKIDLARSEVDQIAADDDLSAESQDQQLSTKKKLLKNLIKKKKEVLNKDKIKKYKRFLSRMYGRDTDNKPIKMKGGVKIFNLEVEPMELFRPPLHAEEEEERRLRAQQKMSSNASERGFKMGAQTGRVGGRESVTDLLHALQDDDSVSAEELKKQWTEGLAGQDAIYIPYFYLGDLIDCIIEGIPGINQGSKTTRNYMTFLANVDVIDPLVFYQLDNQSAVLCGDTVTEAELIQKLQSKGYMLDLNPRKDSALKERINIGSIPISLDQFNVWFKNNVIKPSRPSYYLLHFIKDICSELVAESLRGGCFDTNSINDVRFDASVVHFHNKNKDGNVMIKPRKADPYIGGAGGVVSVTTLARRKGILSGMNDIPLNPDSDKEKKASDVTSGLVVYSTDAKPGTRHGLYGPDLSAGIYHSYIGSSAGLVKKINFERIDQPYLREAKIEKFGSLGAQQLRELYSVNIDMVGNTLYKNGQYIYVDPTLVGGSADMARLLGLGGYFMVSSVTHTIGRSGYNVSIRALQEGLSFKSSATSVSARLSEDGLPIDEDPDAGPAGLEETRNAADRLAADQADTGDHDDSAREKTELQKRIDKDVRTSDGSSRAPNAQERASTLWGASIAAGTQGNVK